MNEPWSIEINSFDGYAPAYWENRLPHIGLRGQSPFMVADLTDPNALKAGRDFAVLTNGDQSGAVTTLIKGIQRNSIDSTATYGGGGNKLYKIQVDAVVSDANFPHTVDKAAVTSEDIDDVCEYVGETWYSYNHSGGAGDVGRLSAGPVFDDDYMSTVPAGAGTLEGNVPHPMRQGGDNKLYIGNGRYLASFDTTTFVAQALDLPSGEVIMDFCWSNNRIFLGSNRPNSSTTQVVSNLYVWDTTSTSWEQQIPVPGRIGAVYARNGVVYVFYQDLTISNTYRLARVEGLAIVDLAIVSGNTMPLHYQVTEYKRHILWRSGPNHYLFGSPSDSLPSKLFTLSYAPISSSSSPTGGGLTNAFGDIYTAHSHSTNFELLKLSGYSNWGAYRTMLFDVADAARRSFVDRVVVFTEPLAEGGQLDTTMVCDYDRVEKTLGSITYANAGDGVRHVILRDSLELSNFQLRLSWANTNEAAAPIVRRVLISGHYADDK